LQQLEKTTNVVYHREDFKGPVLFSFRAKSFFGKKKASIKVEDGEWSDKFSLDFAGSSDVVSCTCGDTTYQVLLRHSLCKCTFIFGLDQPPWSVLLWMFLICQSKG
jgi:vacuolar protein sorting-associated protein 13A/C